MLLPLFLTLGTGAPAAEEIDFYIGTYTSPGGSEGIYQARLNTRTGEISKPALVVQAPNPSFLAIHPNGRFVYAVHELEKGEVGAYEIQPDKTLKLINTQLTVGSYPCHVSVDHGGKNVLTANYGSGSLSCLPIKADGSLAEPSTFFQNTGAGPDSSRQEGPHMHVVHPDANDRFVYACDLGTDEVLVYRFDPAAGALTLSDPRAGKTPPGGGPRHLVFSPDGKFVYVNNEMTSAVTVFERDTATGALNAVQTLGTLPAGDATRNTTAEIALHPSGKWLYVSNRGHDSIAVYEVGSNGRLSLLEITKTGVAEPRGFDIDPSGHWLVVGGQNSNDIVALPIDATGRLYPNVSHVHLSKPVCIVFAR